MSYPNPEPTENIIMLGVDTLTKLRGLNIRETGTPRLQPTIIPKIDGLKVTALGYFFRRNPKQLGIVTIGLYEGGKSVTDPTGAKVIMQKSYDSRTTSGWFTVPLTPTLIDKDKLHFIAIKAYRGALAHGQSFEPEQNQGTVYLGPRLVEFVDDKGRTPTDLYASAYQPFEDVIPERTLLEISTELGLFLEYTVPQTQSI